MTTLRPIFFASVLATVVASVGPALGATTAAQGATAFDRAREGAPMTVGEAFAGRFLAARHAETAGDLETAADINADLLRERPDDGELMRRGFVLLASVGRVGEAAPLAEKVLADAPDDPIARLTLATRDFATGSFAMARAHLDVIEPVGANRILVPLMKAWAFAGEAQFEAAGDLLSGLAQTEGLGPIALFNAALIADMSGDREQAMQAYQSAFASAGDQPSLQLVEAHASFLVRSGKIAEARDLVETFAARHDRSLLVDPLRAIVQPGAAAPPLVAEAREGAAEALHAMASLLSRERGRSQAVILTRLSLYLQPDKAPAQFLLGQILEAQERPRAAIEVYEAIVPDSAYGWFARLNIANVHHAQERTEEAIALLESMTAERPERVDAVRALGDVLRIDKRYEAAIDAYDKAVALAGADIDWRLLYARGIALERAKKWDRAERDFLRALELEPDQPLVLNYLGYSWVEQGAHLERAKAMIESAVAQRPTDGYITDSLGWVLYRLGRYEEAVGHLERAVALEPGDPVINDHLGDAYWLVGRKLEARYQWERALSQDPDEELEALLRAKLEGRERPEPLPPGDGRDI